MKHSSSGCLLSLLFWTDLSLHMRYTLLNMLSECQASRYSQASENVHPNSSLEKMVLISDQITKLTTY